MPCRMIHQNRTVSSNEVEGMLAAIETAGSVSRQLSPYSADLNLIEQIFAGMWVLLRTIAALSVEALWTAIR